MIASQELILVLDFGSQYTQLIARRIRERHVYSEIRPFDISIDEIRRLKPRGIILSGGPSSVYEKNAPLISKQIFDLDIPVLGICYGLQLICHLLGGRVEKAQQREYGHAELKISGANSLFKGIPSATRVWMSHGDRVEQIPENFIVLGSTENSPFCAIKHEQKSIYGIQFHPEVAHTQNGTDLLENFAIEICGCRGEWNPKSFIEQSIAKIQEKVGTANVICGLSGGVDSSVAAALVHRAIGNQLTCVFVNNGLLRLNEAEDVQEVFGKTFHMNFKYVDATEQFLRRLKKVIDPEQKRKIIGEEFIRTFEKAALSIPKAKFLVQGTLYPDVIESVSTRGPSATIKTHHNVGGLPEKMDFELIEPLRELFKDEVREVGRELGLPEKILGRHPFPGPGLAVRIIGEITSERLELLRLADNIFIDELRNIGWYDKVWQAFAVLLPVQTVGVMGDERTYESVIALRAVTSLDAMTADWAKLPAELLARVSNRIINEVKGINRVVYDITSKPPGTIEWE